MAHRLRLSIGTSNLDVAVQAAIIELLRDTIEELAMSLLFVSHDLGVVATVADRIVVIESGSAVEECLAQTVPSSPMEDYTRKLLAAAPREKFGADQGAAGPSAAADASPLPNERDR